MLTIPAGVAAELASTNRYTNFVELIRIVASNVTEYVSYSTVSASISFDGQTYQPRLLRGGLPKLPFPVGNKQEKVDFSFRDEDGHYTALMAAGTVFEQGTVSVVHNFNKVAPPNNAIGNWTNPYWTGRIVKVLPRDGVFKLTVEFGLMGLSRRAFRRFSTACDNSFADGHACPYAPLNGYGHPTATVTGTATGGSATTIVDSGKDFTALGILVGDLVVAKSGANSAAGQVTVVGTTTLTVASWNFNNPASGWTYIAGPARTTCDYLFPTCAANGMTEASSNQYRRKFFTGIGPIAATRYSHTSKNFFGHASTSRYSRPSLNFGLDGQIVPVPIGSVGMTELPVLTVGTDGDRVHAVVIIGEGRCGRLYKIELDGDGMDDQNRSDPPEQGSLVLFGFDGYDSVSSEADAVTAGELTAQQRVEAIGQRAAWSATHSVGVDKYENCPWSFSDPTTGFGVYLSHCAAAYIRTDPKDIDFQGRATAKVFGGTMCRKPDGSPPTYFPTFAEVAYELALNRTWGAGLDASEVDAASAAAIDAYSREEVDSGAAPVVAATTGLVEYGPDDADGEVTLDDNDWFFTAQILPLAYYGAELQITAVGKEQIRTVTSTSPIGEMEPNPDFQEFGGLHKAKASAVGAKGTFVKVDAPWDAGKTPANGDGFSLAPRSLVRRYNAAGDIAKDVSVAEALTSVMRNGLGDHYQSGGLLKFAVRKRESLAAINALTPFTDENTTARNVLVHQDGKSSLYFEPFEHAKTFNWLNVEYVNPEDGSTKTFTVKNQAHMDFLRTTYGKSAKWKVEAKLVLNLVAAEQEAVRVAALWIRLAGARPGYMVNGKIKFSTPVHFGLQLEPFDVYPISGGNLAAWPWIQYVRIESMTESIEPGYMEIEGVPYLDSDYDDPANGLEFDVPDGDLAGEVKLAPRIREIVSVTERLVVDPRGNPQTVLDVVKTLPGDGV